MPVSQYFNNQNATREQWLLEDLVIESIKNHGIDIWYLPRASQSQFDTLFGDDPVKYYNQAIKIDMYLETFSDYTGNKEFYSKFGLQIDESARVAVARRTFEKLVPRNVRNLPKEGDLIFLPVQYKLMEIRFVEEERNFFQLGRDSTNPYMYALSLETFKYNGELLDTGIDIIDEVANRLAPSVNYTLQENNETISFTKNEIAYQGANLASSTAKGIVADFNRPNRILRLRNSKGGFAGNTAIHGVESGASFVVDTFDTQDDATPAAYGDNIDIQNEASQILDFSESDPFNEVL